MAFGSDFTETWDDKSLGLKRAKGTGKLTFLIANVFKGLEKLQANPLFQVILNIFVVGNIAFQKARPAAMIIFFSCFFISDSTCILLRQRGTERQ